MKATSRSRTRARLFALITIASCFGFALLPSQATSAATRLVGPRQAWDATSLSPYDPAHLYFKFAEGTDVRLQGGRFIDGSGRAFTGVEAALAGAGASVLGPTFDLDRVTARQWKAIGEAASGQPGPDLSLWYDAEVTGGRDALARALNALNACPEIEIAHPAPVISVASIGPFPAGAPPAASASIGSGSNGPAPATAPLSIPSRLPITPDFTGRQTYLGPAPVGLNANAAWSQAGGTGDGIKFIDVELCWTEDHEDFDYSRLFFIGGATQDQNYETHGTAVLGEILGQNNGFGINGFAPHVQYGVEAVTVSEWPNVPQYFQDAVNHLVPGDFWQIELQMVGPVSYVPMEYLQVNYDVIWASVWGRGIGCLEAGSNGSQDLDAPMYNGLFDRHVRDSGAIMVAAGIPSTLIPEYFTDYGSRMDAHAWGDQVTTTGYGDLYNPGPLQRRYTAQFSGTSSATPMVCGATLCLQGVALAQLGYTLPPTQLRSIITATGTPQGADYRYIGPRPELGAAIRAIQAIDAVPGARVSPVAQLHVWPNPFHASAVIRWVPSPSRPATIRIADAAGRVVRILSQPPAPGSTERTVVWDGTDGAGREVGNGVYFLEVESGGRAQAAKIARIR